MFERDEQRTLQVRRIRGARHESGLAAHPAGTVQHAPGHGLRGRVCGQVDLGQAREAALLACAGPRRRHICVAALGPCMARQHCHFVSASGSTSCDRRLMHIGGRRYCCHTPAHPIAGRRACQRRTHEVRQVTSN